MPDSKKTMKCKSIYLYPVRYAICSQPNDSLRAKKHLFEPFFAESGLGGEGAFETYHVTLRRLINGYVYVYQNGKLDDAVPVGGDGCWPLKIECSAQKQEVYILFSEDANKALEEKLQKNPAQYMQKITIEEEKSSDYLEYLPVSPDESFHPLVAELVEEAMENPRHAMSIRGFGGALDTICDPEESYTRPTYPVSDERATKHRWRETGRLLKPFSKSSFISKKGCSYLVCLHDPIGMGRELASLHNTSCETITSHAAWYGYAVTVGEELQALLERGENPGRLSYRDRQAWRTIDVVSTKKNQEGFFYDADTSPENPFPGIKIADPNARVRLWDGLMRSQPQRYRVMTHVVRQEVPSGRYAKKIGVEYLLQELRADSMATSQQPARLYDSLSGALRAHAWQDNARIYSQGGAFYKDAQNARIRDAVTFVSILPSRYGREEGALLDALAVLVKDWQVWLRSAGKFGFGNAFHAFDPSTTRSFRAKEAAFAESHRAVSMFDPGKAMIKNLFRSAPVWERVFWEVVTAEGALEEGKGLNNSPVVDLVEYLAEVLAQLRESGDLRGKYETFMDAINARMEATSGQGASSQPEAGQTAGPGAGSSPGGKALSGEESHKQLDLALKEYDLRAKYNAVLLQETPPDIQNSLPSGKSRIADFGPWLGVGASVSEKFFAKFQSSVLASEEKILNKVVRLNSIGPDSSVGRVLYTTGRVILFANLVNAAHALKEKGSEVDLADFVIFVATLSSNLALMARRTFVNQLIAKTLRFGRLSHLMHAYPSRFLLRFAGPVADIARCYQYVRTGQYEASMALASGGALGLAVGGPGGFVILVSAAFLAALLEHNEIDKYMKNTPWGIRYDGVIKKYSPLKDGYPQYSYKDFYKKQRDSDSEWHPILTEEISNEAKEDAKTRARLGCNLECYVETKGDITTVSCFTSIFSYTESFFDVRLGYFRPEYKEILERSVVDRWAPRFDKETQRLCFSFSFNRKTFASLCAAKGFATFYPVDIANTEMEQRPNCSFIRAAFCIDWSFTFMEGVVCNGKREYVDATKAY